MLYWSVQVYPELDYTSSTVLLEATVKSPIDILFQDHGNSEEVEGEGDEWEVESDDLLSDDADLVPVRKKRGNSLSSGQGSQAYSSHARPLDSPKKSRKVKMGTTTYGKPMTARQVYTSHPRPVVTRETPVKNPEKQVDKETDIDDDDGVSFSVHEKLHTLLSNYADPSCAQKDVRGRSHSLDARGRSNSLDARGRAPTQDTGERGLSHSRRQSASSRAQTRRRHQSGE